MALPVIPVAVKLLAPIVGGIGAELVKGHFDNKKANAEVKKRQQMLSQKLLLWVLLDLQQNKFAMLLLMQKNLKSTVKKVMLLSISKAKDDKLYIKTITQL